MKLHRITSFAELEELLPLILTQKRLLKGRLGGDTEVAFMQELLGGFKQNLYFGEAHNGTLLYFFAVTELDYEQERCLFVRTAYVDRFLYHETQGLIDQLIDFARPLGYKTVMWISTRLGKAYQKWMDKISAKLVSKVYKLEI